MSGRRRDDDFRGLPILDRSLRSAVRLSVCPERSRYLVTSWRKRRICSPLSARTRSSSLARSVAIPFDAAIPSCLSVFSPRGSHRMKCIRCCCRRHCRLAWRCTLMRIHTHTHTQSSVCLAQRLGQQGERQKDIRISHGHKINDNNLDGPLPFRPTDNNRQR